MLNWNHVKKSVYNRRYSLLLDHYAGTYGVSLFAGDELKEVYIGQHPPITL